MPEGLLKSFYLLEPPKAPGATYAKILGDETNVEMGNQQATQIEIGWLAGIIDGEGYIGLQTYKTRNRHPSVSAEMFISNTDEKIILKAQKIIQKMGVNPYIRVNNYKLKNNPTHKIAWIVVVHRMNKLIRVLEVISPYLTGNKKERGELVLEYCRIRLSHYVPGSHHNVITAREMEILELCIAKQKRGASETTRKAQLENSELNRQKSESRRNRNNGRYSHFPTCDDIVRPFAKA